MSSSVLLLSVALGALIVMLRSRFFRGALAFAGLAALALVAFTDAGQNTFAAVVADAGTLAGAAGESFVERLIVAD